MGIFRTTISVAALASPDRRLELADVMVDTGSEYNWVPRDVLLDLGVAPVRIDRFETADGRVLEREVGFALFYAGGRSAAAAVVFAEHGDMVLLGAHGLEGLNMRVDLGRKALVPAGLVPAAASRTRVVTAARVCGSHHHFKHSTMKAMGGLVREWCMASMIVGAAAAMTVVVGAAPLRAQDDQLAERAKRAGEVLSELTSAPDSAPPNALLNEAVCVAVVPGVVQAGFGIGGKAGFGLVSCRTATGWSWPTFVGLKGGSFGFQIGAQSADVVLIFVNENAPRTIAASSFDIGGEASVAAGPLGRTVSAATDYRGQAEIYSYSKSKGLFAGIKIAGTKWEIDYAANKKAYASAPDSLKGGTHTSVATQLRTDGSAAPAIVQSFLESLQQHVAKSPTG